MDNTTLPFYFVWSTLKLGTYFPMEVKPCADRQYDTQKGEVVNPPYIKVDVPFQSIYVENGNVLTVEGRKAVVTDRIANNCLKCGAVLNRIV